MEKEGVHLCQGSGRAGDDAVALQETSSVVPVALAYWGHPVVDTRHRTHGRVTRWQGRVDGDEVPACLFVEPFAHPRERAHTYSFTHMHISFPCLFPPTRQGPSWPTARELREQSPPSVGGSLNRVLFLIVSW